MHILYLLALLPVSALAAVNGRCTGSKATGYWKDSGICISTTNCKNRGGVTKDDACPGDGDNIKCCLIGAGKSDVSPCGLYSHCTWTSEGCAGQWYSGKSMSWKRWFRAPDQNHLANTTQIQTLVLD
ncbi:hypothetical protein ACHAQH_007462 [Verticillium albo-atrum]